MVAQYLHSKARQNHLSLSFGTLLFWKGDVLRGSGQNPMTDLPWLLNTHSFQLFYQSRACVCLDLFMPLLHKEARRGCTCLTFLSSPRGCLNGHQGNPPMFWTQFGLIPFHPVTFPRPRAESISPVACCSLCRVSLRSLRLQAFGANAAEVAGAGVRGSVGWNFDRLPQGEAQDAC